jgi:hypothetical protein
MSSPTNYPVRVEATRDPRLSRWLWLVKWVLAIPHYLVLVFLWIGFVLLSVAAFVAILATGRYPRPIFDFNVGVMRWTWRVQHYAYGALGTDRYPPFTLADVPDYPAHLDVEYPARLSRGLVLVKWWLLAIPHYLIVGLFVGGVAFTVNGSDNNGLPWASGGIVGVLVLVAAIVLAVKGAYPPAIYDLVVGMDRWAIRVAAYAALMTDVYPPFRLDQGGSESGPTGPGTVPSPGAPGTDGRALPVPGAGSAGWTAGRVAAVVTGAVVTAGSLGLLAGGSALLWADRTQRDDAGYISAGEQSYRTTGYALTSEQIDLSVPHMMAGSIEDLIGTLRARIEAADPGREVFLGIARSADAERYLAGAAYASIGDVASGTDNVTEHRGGPISVPPDQTDIWVARTTGSGTQEVTWKPENGSWTVVAMNADASAGLNLDVQAAATLPGLPWVVGCLLGGGGLFLLVGVVLIVVPARRAGRMTAPPAPTAKVREPVGS